MKHLILIRHGQSIWNLKKRFTGWVDIELTDQGKSEACKAGELIKKLDLKINHYFSSYQKRAIDTLELILKITDSCQNKIIKAWELNERHYGNLTGLNKEQTKKIYGEKKIHKLRRSWDYPPKPLSNNSPYHPLNIEIYKDIPRDKIPNTESLKNTYERVIPYYEKNIKNKLDKNILISAHGNSIRSLCKYLFKIDNENISNLEIPTGNPLALEFDDNKKVKFARYLDKERAKDLLAF